MSKQKPMTKSEREKARKRREQLKDAPTQMKLKGLTKIKKGKLDRPSKPARPSKKRDPLLVHRNGKPFLKKLTKKQKEKLNKIKLKIGG
tara:strand:+ start:94 stop:360 length:267 start_codon:yes stop_codon:yes gene_type:complete